MLIAIELQTCRVYVSLHPQGLLKPSDSFVRIRKIALHDEYACLWEQRVRLGRLHGEPAVERDVCLLGAEAWPCAEGS